MNGRGVEGVGLAGGLFREAGVPYSGGLFWEKELKEWEWDGWLAFGEES